MQLLQFTSTSFSVPLLWSASDASASLPRKIGFSNFFLNSDTVPGIVDRTISKCYHFKGPKNIRTLSHAGTSKDPTFYLISKIFSL